MVQSSVLKSENWFGRARSTLLRFQKRSDRSRFTPYLLALAIAIISVAIRFPLDPWLGPTRAAFLIPSCAITFVAVFYGFLPALMTEVLCAFGVVFFILPPRFTLKIGDPEMEVNFVTFAAATFVCAVLGSVAHRARKAKDEIAHQFEQTLTSSATGLTRCTTDMRYVMVNAAYARVLGVPPEKLIGQKISDVLGEDVMERIRPQIERVLAGETVEYQIDVPIAGQGTRSFHFNHSPDRDNDGKVVGWVTSVDDLTERIQAEQALRDSEEHYRSLFDVSVHGILTIDEHGIISAVNPATERIFGYSADEMIGVNVSILMAEPYKREHDSYIENYRRTRVPKIIGIGREVVGRRKDGTEFPLDLAVSEFTIGGKRYFRGGISDISARKQAEDALRKSEARLRAAKEELEQKVEERTRELFEANKAFAEEAELRVREEQQRVDLLKRLAQTQESERSRIGRDIHDHLGQRLTAFRLQLQSLKEVMDHAPAAEPAVSRVETLTALSKELDAEVSYLAWELRPTVLDQFGLVETLRLFVSEWSKQNGVAGEFHQTKLGETPFDKETETHLYRITQEALNNIAKHADAKNVSVHLSRRDGNLSLIIDDDGRGFVPNGKAVRKEGLGGLGLRGMKERAELIGGDVEIQSQPGSGTTIFVRIAESATERNARATGQNSGSGS